LLGEICYQMYWKCSQRFNQTAIMCVGFQLVAFNQVNQDNLHSNYIYVTISSKYLLSTMMYKLCTDAGMYMCLSSKFFVLIQSWHESFIVSSWSRSWIKYNYAHHFHFHKLLKTSMIDQVNYINLSKIHNFIVLSPGLKTPSTIQNWINSLLSDS
jgi:hypothetical protein